MTSPKTRSPATCGHLEGGPHEDVGRAHARRPGRRLGRPELVPPPALNPIGAHDLRTGESPVVARTEALAPGIDERRVAMLGSIDRDRVGREESDQRVD